MAKIKYEKLAQEIADQPPPQITSPTTPFGHKKIGQFNHYEHVVNLGRKLSVIHTAGTDLKWPLFSWPTSRSGPAAGVLFSLFYQAANDGSDYDFSLIGLHIIALTITLPRYDLQTFKKRTHFNTINRQLR